MKSLIDKIRSLTSYPNVSSGNVPQVQNVTNGEPVKFKGKGKITLMNPGSSVNVGVTIDGHDMVIHHPGGTHIVFTFESSFSVMADANYTDYMIQLAD